jgi:hypothetical protein
MTRTQGEHKILDFWVLLLLFELPDNRKRVESLFKKKITVGHFTEQFLQKVYKDIIYVVQISHYIEGDRRSCTYVSITLSSDCHSC